MTLDALNRKSERGSTDRADLDRLLDEVLVGTLSTVVDGLPWSVPILFARDGDRILLHGSTGGGVLRQVAAGAPAAFAVHIIDGLVVAASGFDSSANYRSAVLRGTVRALKGDAAWQALRVLTDRLIPDRTAEIPDMTGKQVAATLTLELPITQWLFKQRTGGVGGDAVDGVWTGVVPLRQVAGQPVADPATELPVPASVRHLVSKYPGFDAS